MRAFIRNHDHSKVFFVLYLTLSVGLSVIFNLGFFILLAGIHYAMDIAKHKMNGLNNLNAIRASARECILDIMFIFIGLASAIVLQRADS